MPSRPNRKGAGRVSSDRRFVLRASDPKLTVCPTRAPGDGMRATAKLQELGQSLWLDNITRELLDSGRLRRYVGV